MERDEYDKLDRVEGRMWWFAAAHANLLAMHRRVAAGPSRSHSVTDRPLLDAGCGTGGFLARIRARCPGRGAMGVDADAEACRRAGLKSRRPVCVGSVNALPFADASFGAIFSADVLCHRDVDESRALAQFHRCLSVDGLLVLNLPAYRWMLSRHDVAVHNVRRYTRSSVAALLRGAGFRPLFMSYWNMLLFPLMMLTRKLGRRGDGGSDVKLYPPPIEALCRAVTAAERALLRAGMPLPFGGSVIAVATKPGPG